MGWGDLATLTLPLCFAAGGLCPRGAGAAAAGAGPGQLCAGKMTPTPASAPRREATIWSPLTHPLYQVWRSDVRFARKQLLCPDSEWGSQGTKAGGGHGQTPLMAPSLSQSPTGTLGC